MIHGDNFVLMPPKYSFGDYTSTLEYCWECIVKVFINESVEEGDK